jgi:hypothetical protein
LRKKRYNEKFVAYIDTKCQEIGDLQPVGEQYYEMFVSLTKDEMVGILSVILGETAKSFNKMLFSGAWKSDDEMYEFVFPFLELVAEGRLVFNPETGRLGLCKPVGDPPSDEMWDRIQERIVSSKSAFRKAIVENVRRGRK